MGENLAQKNQTISWLKTAFEATNKSEARLLLPTIQRSLVWDNKRIIDYWDTLAKGWFPGLFMVRKLTAKDIAYSVSGEIAEETQASENDLEIFDGQQRIAAIMLGFGLGRLAQSKKIWIAYDKGEEKYIFRISSLGQPFGYQIANPNNKFELHQRRDKFETFTKELKDNQKLKSNEINKTAFEKATDDILIKPHGKEHINWYWLKNVLSDNWNEIKDPEDQKILKDFKTKIEETNILLRYVTNDEFNEYEEFFRRIGQGGVRMTDDELTYALMNRQFPALRPLMETVIDEKEIGYLASPTDIALSLFRLAIIDAAKDYEKLNDWERANRPNPTYLTNLKDETFDDRVKGHAKKAEEKFKSWIKDNDALKAQTLLKDARNFIMNSGDNIISPIMLSMLDKYVIEIAMLLCHHEKLKTIDEQKRRSFLYWAMFFANTEKVAYRLAVNASLPEMNDKDILQETFDFLQEENDTIAIPTHDNLKNIHCSIKKIDKLVPYDQWFTAADPKVGKKPSQILYHLHFGSWRGKILLLWMQRDYLNKNYPSYDPTSENDEDLPIDLDHIIARSHMDFTWRGDVVEKLKEKLGDDEQHNIFNAVRKALVNVIGNLRWLDASENRSRGAGGGEVDLQKDDKTLIYLDYDQIKFLESFSKNLNKKHIEEWCKIDLICWQKTVLLRTIELLQATINDWGVYQFLPQPANK